MRRAFIFGSIGLLVAAAAGGASWLLLQGPGAVEHGQSARLPDVAFHRLGPVVVPMFRSGRLIKHVTLEIALEVSAEDEQRVVRSMARLRDAYLAELHGLFSFRFVQDHEYILPLIKRRLLAVSQREMGPGVVREVLVQLMEERRRTAG